ncbi:hypothetical protein SteCoe_31447 [Stentor coeruleus]|uniref:Uncharacterized protein n=1 Tax=Stentor coeruleus TaxID=5963 RepID=A0A1R2B1H2_9CILI|nr:hypothetical protein SteCoe_31447 [Stentor coeruleus]
MSKEIEYDKVFFIPKLTVREILSSEFKSQDQDESSEVKSVMHRRNSATKGKQMMDIKRKSQELNFRLHSLENRIRYIENEQIRAQKNVWLARQKYSKINQIRQTADSEKRLNATAKEIKIKEFLENKEKISNDKSNQKQRIILQREKLLKKNKLIKQEMKSNIIMAEAERLKRKQEEIEILQRKNKEILNSSKEFSEKKKVRTNSQKAVKENEYFRRMQDEIDYQRQALDKIKSLERLEEILLEQRKTADILETLDSELLCIPVSPLNITSKISLF